LGKLPTKAKNTIVQPDLCVICDPQKIVTKGCVGSPDLVIEILSPANSRKEMREKYDLYEQCGVSEYWVVFTEEQIIQRYLLNNEGIYQPQKPNVTGDVISPLCLSGLIIDVTEVFE
jgi:Uma2 family endonuclease